jgi:hypothetical protein
MHIGRGGLYRVDEAAVLVNPYMDLHPVGAAPQSGVWSQPQSDQARATRALPDPFRPGTSPSW